VHQTKKIFRKKVFLCSTTTRKICWIHWWNPLLNPFTITGDICHFVPTASALSNRSLRSVYNYARRPILRIGLRPVQLFLVFPCTFALQPNTNWIGWTVSMRPFKIIQDGTAAILNSVQPEVETFDPPTSKTLPYNQTWSGSDDPLPRYGHSKFAKMRGRSVGRSSVLNIHCSHTLLFATLGTSRARSKNRLH